MSGLLKAALPLCLVAGCTPAPGHLDKITAVELERRLDAATAKAPGVAYGMNRPDGTTLLRVAGKADLATGRAVTPETSFGWFSITKLFTATAVLQLSERGLIDLDAPAAKYLPGMRLQREGREATVRQLLSHTAGIPNPVPLAWIHPADQPGPSLDEMIGQRLGKEPQLDFVPGTKTAYSNLGYVLLGRIVERVSGTAYTRYVEEHVLSPLGCRSSGFARPAGQATAYQEKWSLTGLAAWWMLDHRFMANTVGGYWEIRPLAVDGTPHGGLNGNLDCLLRYGRMALRNGEINNGRLLSPQSVQAMLTPTRTSDGQPAPFGLAWRFGSVDGEPFATHDGGGGGYRAELRIYPRLGYAVAVMANETGFSTVELARTIVK